MKESAGNYKVLNTAETWDKAIEPKRIQRKRTKGWRMPENAVSVARPGRFGNIFKLSEDGYILYKKAGKLIGTQWCYWSITAGGFTTHDIVELYRIWISGELIGFRGLPDPPDIELLKGKDLACFCSLEKPCHADVLIELANSRDCSNARNSVY